MFKFLYIFCILFYYGHSLFTYFEKERKIKVTGELFCNGNEIKNAIIDVYDSPYVGSDTLINRTKSNQYGEFMIFGKITKFLPLKSYIYIYDHCGAKNTFCYFRRQIHLSLQKSINGKKLYEKVWKLGKIDLFKTKIYNKNKVHLKSKEKCDSIFKTIYQKKSF